MPQGRRKVPFSGKAKKDQLKNKHLKKQGQSSKAILTRNQDEEDDRHKIKKINQQPQKGAQNPNRYNLQFFCDSSEELKLNKEEAHKEIIPVDQKLLEIHTNNFFSKDVEFPKRPKWSYQMDKCELLTKEERYFAEYLNNLEKGDWKKMSYFELNLETWRQLWRVLEMSDIILYIVDIRYAAAMFPPSLYDYVTEVLKKDFILVLNKIDLAPAPLVVAWKTYFKEKFPKLNIVLFTTLPGYNLRGNQSEKSVLKSRRVRGRIRMAAEGAQLLYETCQSIVKDDIDLSSWKRKIQEEMSQEYEDEDIDIGEVIKIDKIDTSYFQHEKYKNGILTIGCVGQPNVGKSSLMNAIMGKKVVSVSKTPGHTKHFQTIFLTKNVMLCDCPGLVFPSYVPKSLQVLMGSYPIAQLRDPFTSVKYLAERLNLVDLLKLQHPSDDDTWSAVDICDGWAKKRGFITAKAARLDSYRAANHLLRMTLDGKICLCLYPPNYLENKGEWSSHPDVKQVQWIQALNNTEESTSTKIVYSDSSDEEEEIKQDNQQKIETETESDTDKDNTSEDSEDDSEIVEGNKFAVLGEC